MIHPNGLVNARFNTDQFWHMGEWGFFHGRHVMLVNGDILELPRDGPYHFASVTVALETLTRSYGEAFYVRRPGPLAFSAWTDPEPDIAVVRGDPRSFEDAHPTTALLVVEVSERSLEVDRTIKLQLYAKHGIPEFWILNLPDRRLEIYSSPVERDGGWTYGEQRTLGEADRILPPDAVLKVAVAELLLESPLRASEGG